VEKPAGRPPRGAAEAENERRRRDSARNRPEYHATMPKPWTTTMSGKPTGLELFIAAGFFLLGQDAVDSNDPLRSAFA
jgi:hypothetical protein